MSAIAIIPARGGSKRIPRKNIRKFHGKPIISYAINTAIESNLFNEIFVTTDDLEIAEIARSYGAIVPWIRAKNLSDDFATTLSVISNAVSEIKLSFKVPRNVCCIYPATPLLNPDDLKNAKLLLENGNWDYVVSVIKSNHHPQRFFSLDERKQIELFSPLYEKVRTQDLPISYMDAGQFYWGTDQSWQDCKPIFTSNSSVFELPNESVVDIDNEEDWKKAEEMYSVRNSMKAKELGSKPLS